MDRQKPPAADAKSAKDFHDLTIVITQHNKQSQRCERLLYNSALQAGRAHPLLPLETTPPSSQTCQDPILTSATHPTAPCPPPTRRPAFTLARGTATTSASSLPDRVGRLPSRRLARSQLPVQGGTASETGPSGLPPLPLQTGQHQQPPTARSRAEQSRAEQGRAGQLSNLPQHTHTYTSSLAHRDRQPLTLSRVTSSAVFPDVSPTGPASPPRPLVDHSQLYIASHKLDSPPAR